MVGCVSFRKSKIGVLNPKESEVDSSVAVTHRDARDLDGKSIFGVSDLKIQSWRFLEKRTLRILTTLFKYSKRLVRCKS